MGGGGGGGDGVWSLRFEYRYLILLGIVIMDLMSLLDLFVFALFTCRGPFSNSENMVAVIVFLLYQKKSKKTFP